MQGRLLIKHAVGGRTFLDSVKTGTKFEVTELGNGGGWRFHVNTSGDAVGEILRWREELNLFIFEEDRDPVVKHWFYVVADRVNYDETSGLLRLEASSELEYVPDTYTW
jgi:hypothetical protein